VVKRRLNPEVVRSAKGRSRLALAAAVAAILLTTGCGAGNSSSTTSSKPACNSFPRESKAALAKLKTQSNVILDCGVDGFKRQLDALAGYAIVVNKWASWCGPCRFEFPFFRRLAAKHAGKVAFVGLDAEDSQSDARKFLKKFPVPYPSFFDPKSKVATVFRGQRVFPTTAFYDSKGELVFTKQGGYASEPAIESDITRYAR
jgi:cytochrome c biogenesis protein CcmG, thiol:disulfide interchange protein DsbE